MANLDIRNGKPQCQICGELGYTINDCYFRLGNSINIITKASAVSQFPMGNLI